MPAPRIDARAARPNLLSFSDAAQTVERGSTFAVDEDTAAKLVGRIPADLMGLASTRLELGKQGWQNPAGNKFLEISFPRPVKHLDGPFARAFVDVARRNVWFVTKNADKELQREMKRFKNPPPDLLGSPRAPSVNVVGGVSLGPLAKTLKLGTGAADAFTGGTAESKNLSSAAVSRRAREFILDRVGAGAGKLFPAVDDGNVGLSAMVVDDAPAKRLIAAAKEGFPGIKTLKKLDFDPAKQKLFAVITSDDEPALHLNVMDRKTGEVTYVAGINTVDLPVEPLGLDPEADDNFAALSAIAKGASFLSLGSGSAPNRWWE